MLYKEKFIEMNEVKEKVKKEKQGKEEEKAVVPGEGKTDKHTEHGIQEKRHP